MLLKKAITAKFIVVFFAVLLIGQSLGAVVIILVTNKTMHEDIAGSMFMIGLYQVVTLFSVGAVMVYLFNRNITMPVRRINREMKKVQTGDLTTDLADMGDNEIGGIAGGIRFLAEQLSKTTESTHSISGNTATAMEKLTVALRSVSETVRGEATSINAVVSAVRSANDSQGGVRENADKLSSVSSENVSSLLEMKATAEEIAASTGRLFKSAEDSYAMVAETTQSAKLIAENAGEAFRAVEDTSSSVEEISASVSAVLENARKSADLSAHLRLSLTERGTLAIANSLAAMEEIEEEVNQTAEIITRLDERSKNIEKVLSVIREVTEGTNLLSLNAAILAAQAGEYGKSFGVVADEIRALSDRTSSSARDIANIVRTIQGEIAEAVRSIGTGAKKVDAGKDLIFKVGEALGETVETAQKSAQMAEVIEKATDEQAAGLKQITRSMDNIHRIIEAMVRAAEEQKKGSNHILEAMSDVKEV
ncbi:MAG TPA: HAMP domain-containing methyl-accepting chemotaxis protein, partial [Thermodesulfovibrionales bacterium]|nr:HAMP domain-containing methyl-accepting chemotaxis protein [Thermodesulfovibrionales bacterium]